MPQPQELLPIAGIKLASLACGIKTSGKQDLALIEMCQGASLACLFTKSATRAAPVLLSQKHLATRNPGEPSYLLINSGNANAATGTKGMEACLATTQEIAQHARIEPHNVLAFSTGIIGVPLPVENILPAIPKLMADLAEDNWLQVAEAIKTTDAFTKCASQQVGLPSGKKVTITAIAKGAGMIHPDMATMLAFAGTDASILEADCEKLLRIAADRSFHAISVDGDSSTNDSLVCIATHKSQVRIASSDENQDWDFFVHSFTSLLQKLAKMIVADGEGSSKIITASVRKASNFERARSIAQAIVCSPLVKTALHANDPNWGRIIMAIGKSVEYVDMDKLQLDISDVRVFAQGSPQAFDKQALHKCMASSKEVVIQVNLFEGTHSAVYWGSDLGHSYIDINANYLASS